MRIPWLVPLLLGVSVLSVALSAAAQIVASGNTLTVTTTNAVATFTGPDLTGFTNTATGESYLKSAPPVTLMNLEVNGTPSGSLKPTTWSTSAQSGTTVASYTMTDPMRTVTISVKVDSTSQEIVVNLTGTATGVSNAYWAIAGIDLSAGHMVVPASSGIVIDEQHEQIGSTMQYPRDWMAQMAVYETAAGSMLVYSTDQTYAFKQLRVSTHANPTIDLLFASQANGPWNNATSVPNIEWRIKAFAGDWRTAAGVYRDWLAANRTPVSNANYSWVNNIQTVAQMYTLDTTALAALATEVTPSKTLLYLVNWRLAAYDNNYPDYTPASGAAAYVAQAHKLGFKVMLHTDMIGVTPSNSDFASMQQWQVKDPSTLAVTGWEWSSPVSTPNRFAYINPAASEYRKLFIARVGAAITALQPDALHLDISAPMFNDGNGIIEGMTYPQGVTQLHKDLLAAYPNIALAGEGTDDIISPSSSFAQNWWAGADSSVYLGHPICNFLWNSQPTGMQTRYYGHLGLPVATDSGFLPYTQIMEREGFQPGVSVNSSSDLDLTNADNARLINRVQAWQAGAYQPNWTGKWSGVVVPYSGSNGATASLADTGTLATLSAGGTTIYQRAHNTNQVASSSSFILNWPAFDAAQMYGLDSGTQYWLDPASRSSTTHVSSLPSTAELGADTMVSTNFALVQLAAIPPYDFVDNLYAATIGITFNGSDGSLGFGATAQVESTTVGGVTRNGIFMQPPYLGGHAGGEAFVEWSLPVPAASAFTFAVGIRDGAGTCTDGVTFRVAINGTEAWRQNVQIGAWVNGSVDLSAYAGQTSKVRIITNPGPANNTSCDWASYSNLAFTALNGVTASVPMVLGGGSVVAGFSGSGSYSSSGSLSGTVSNVVVPGEFVLFTGPGSAVSAGSNLANLPFVNWLGTDGQIAAPGSIYNSGTIGSATSGGVTKQNAIFGHPPNQGRTILSWTLALPSTANLQLGWSSAMEDGSQSPTGVQFSVRINGATFWTMFQQTPAGWKPGSLDLTSWRGQNILVQLVTDSVGDNNDDHGWWADLNLTTSSGSCAYTLPSGVSIAAGSNSGSTQLTTGSGCPWSATTDVPWISLTATTSGLGNGTIAYAVLPNSTAAARTGHILAGGQSFAITQAAGVDPLAPTFPAAGLVNGASFLAGMAPGMIATIFGTHLSTATGIVGASTIPLPSQIMGTSVTVGGVAAPMFNIVNVNGSEQISFEIPWEISKLPFADVIVTSGSHVSAPVSVNIVAANPGIFTTDGTSGVILHGVSNQLITASSPAAPGEVVVIYATGLGAVSPTPGDGAASGASQTTAKATVTIGGVAGSVQYAGMAPGFVGLYQVNVQIPTSVASGNLNVVLNISGQTSKTVTMAVQ